MYSALSPVPATGEALRKMFTRTNTHTDKIPMSKHIFSLNFIDLKSLEENLKLESNSGASSPKLKLTMHPHTNSICWYISPSTGLFTYLLFRKNQFATFMSIL